MISSIHALRMILGENFREIVENFFQSILYILYDEIKINWTLDDPWWPWPAKTLFGPIGPIATFFSEFFLENFLCNNSFYWLLQLITPLKTIKKILKNTLFWIGPVQFFGPFQYLAQFKLFSELLMELF